MDYTDYEERISSDQGNYIVTGDKKQFEAIVEKKPLVLKSITINPGTKSDFLGWFDKPCRYIGIMDNAAIFFLGKAAPELFHLGAYYYDMTYIIDADADRIGKSYKAGSFRDYYYKKGRWK